MDNLTPQQKDQIKSWSEERDTLLRDISLLRNAKDILINKANGEGISGEDILIILGEIDGLKKKKDLLSDEISVLKTEKISLDIISKDKTNLISEISVLERQKRDLIEQNSTISTEILTKEQEEEKNNFLNEIAALRVEKENLTKANKDLGISNSELTNSIHVSIGRIEELKKKEEDLSKMTSTEVTNLLIKKSILEGQITDLSKEVAYLEDKKSGITEDIVNQKEIYNDLFDKAGTLREIVGHVVAISDKNIIKLEQHSSILVDKVKEVVAISTENINKHNVILDEIPKIFVELKRKSLEREPLKKIKHTP